MNAKELRDLLADVPDNWDVGIEVVIGDDSDVFLFAGKSDTRWDHTLALLTKEETEKYVKLA